jgi:nucleotide-binding universal stress UspA family protein
VAVVVPGVLVPKNEYDLRTEQVACNCLRILTDEAASAGVASRALHVWHRDPYVAILETARKEGCDLIVMASHGRRGLTELLLGSETVKVLTHSEIPVLVYRRP